MTQAKKLYRGNVTAYVAKGSYGGSPDAEIFFLAPIELLTYDQVFIDQASGRPLAVYRDNQKIWEFRGEWVSGSAKFTAEFDPDVLAYLTRVKE